MKRSDFARLRKSDPTTAIVGSHHTHRSALMLTPAAISECTAILAPTSTGSR